MSIFTRARVPCPACDTLRQFKIVESVNADRRPDLRTSIIDGSFQREACDHCGNTFVCPPMMSYLDQKQGWWILARPFDEQENWQSFEAETRRAFNLAYGANAPAAAQAIGRDLRVRAVFGWAALREKLRCSEAGIDDITLELLKMAIMRDVPAPDLSDDHELRLVRVEGDELVLAWIHGATEDVASTLRVPRAGLDSIEADPQAWAGAREALGASVVVDINRLLIGEREQETGAAAA